MAFWDEESYGSNGNSTINVGGTIQWIKNNTVPALFKTSSYQMYMKKNQISTFLVLFNIMEIIFH